jgi:alkylation response protein AidB-like acyl-CoA dehydrogenase
MDLRYSDADERFRKELRDWLAAEVPKHGAPPPRHDWDARRAWDTAWQRKLFDAGYAGMSWPRAYGGRGATLTEELIYYEETARARAPYVGMNFVGIRHGGPTLKAPSCRSSAICRASCAARKCGVRASRSRWPAPISRRSRPPRCATATITW